MQPKPLEPDTPDDPDVPDTPEDPQPPEVDLPAERYQGIPKKLYSDDPSAQVLSEISLAELKKKNEEVIGWIFMPDSDINYPLVQTTDNEHYLTYTWEQLWSLAGAIYLDYRNSADLNDFHTIIYGHRMSYGTMFSDLNKFTEDPTFWETHRSVYLALPGGRVYRYDVFAFYEADVTGHTYRLGLTDTVGKDAYIAYCQYHSLADTGIVPRADGHVLTLSTCTGHGHHSRCVVQAVRAVEFVETEDMLENIE